MSNATEKASNLIRNHILSGKLTPGSRLREEELTQLTGVSRTPVREALRLLDKEGYVTIEQNRGAAVTIYTQKDIDEIYGLRALLESHAARRAATRITPEQIKELEKIHHQMVSQTKTPTGNKRTDMKTREKRIRLNLQFHKIILDASDNARLSSFVGQLSQIALTARTFSRYGLEGDQRSNAAHEELIRALKSGQPDWTEATMRSHVHDARQVMNIFTQGNVLQDSKTTQSKG